MTTPPRAHALAVSAEFAYVDGIPHPGVFARGPLPLVRLVERASRAGDDPGVVLVVDDDALPLLGLPARLGAGSEHEAAPEEARAAGWRVSNLGHWTSFWRTGAPAVHMVVPAWSGKYSHGPLVVPGALGVSTYRLARFHTYNGGPFQLTPGWSGIDALRERKYIGTPFWRPRFAGALGNAARLGERDLSWEAPATLDAGEHRHRYDANTAYLAAAQLAGVAGDQLERTGKAWDAKRAGYWLITAPAWQHPQMPDPTASLTPDDKGRLWVCTPTLALLYELAEAGHCAPPALHDSHTAPATRKILRPWAERLRDGLADLDATRHDPDDEAVRTALKASFREAVGMFAHSGTSLYRPDWRHAVISQCRVSLWRRLWTIGQAQGRWPLSVLVDAVEYGSDDPDPASACPDGLALGPGLGKFHVYAREAVGAPA